MPCAAARGGAVSQDSRRCGDGRSWMPVSGRVPRDPNYTGLQSPIAALPIVSIVVPFCWLTSFMVRIP